MLTDQSAGCPSSPARQPKVHAGPAQPDRAVQCLPVRLGQLQHRRAHGQEKPCLCSRRMVQDGLAAQPARHAAPPIQPASAGAPRTRISRLGFSFRSRLARIRLPSGRLFSPGPRTNHSPDFRGARPSCTLPNATVRNIARQLTQTLLESVPSPCHLKPVLVPSRRETSCRRKASPSGVLHRAPACVSKLQDRLAPCQMPRT